MVCKQQTSDWLRTRPWQCMILSMTNIMPWIGVLVQKKIKTGSNDLSSYQFLRILAQTRSADTLLFYVAALNHFSKFLDKYYSQIAPEAINRKVGVDFLTYLKRSILSK